MKTYEANTSFYYFIGIQQKWKQNLLDQRYITPTEHL